MNLSQECFTTRQILKKTVPVLRAIHDQDGDWQFLSGEDFDMDDAAMVSLNQITEIDGSIFQVIDIPKNHQARRSHEGEKWVIEKL